MRKIFKFLMLISYELDTQLDVELEIKILQAQRHEGLSLVIHVC